MISEFTPPGVKIIALRSGYGIEAGKTYTVRGMILNRHWRTREPDAHVLVDEAVPPSPYEGSGYPRCAFEIPSFSQWQHARCLEVVH